MRVENASERQLIVANEELCTLEDVVRIMPTAQYVNVAFNCVSSLCGIEKMTELRSLDISHNTIESLQEVATLSKLLVLKCSTNHISDLSWIAGLNGLEELWIRDNRIENAQLAHLQQLTTLQTLVIHPNPCTERDDYVLVMLKVLPWLQRVDTVIVTNELREEARHTEERETLDSGATDCSLFSLPEDPTSTEEAKVATATTTSSEPRKLKKQITEQMTAEDIMRAFPVQEFIPLDRNGESAVPVDDHLMNAQHESLQPQCTPSTQPETEENQKEIAKDHDGAHDNQPLPEREVKSVGVSPLLDSVLTLPTFDNNSFLKKKPQSKLPGNNKSKKRKSKSEILTATLPFHQVEEYTESYPNSTVTAIQIRRDGSAIARWPSGSVAVSVDFETSSEGSGYRVYAAHKDGQLALSFDPAGVGFLNAYPSGKTLLSTTSDRNGLLFDTTTGGIARQWDSQGTLRDGACQPAKALGDEPDGSLLCRLSEQLAVCVNLTADNKKKEAARVNPIALRICFAGSAGIRHVFVNSANPAEPSKPEACDSALGKTSSKENITKPTKTQPPVKHADLLSSIRAAVAGL